MVEERKLAGRVLVLLIIIISRGLEPAVAAAPLLVAMDNGEMLNIELLGFVVVDIIVVVLLLSYWAVISSFSQRPLNRNLDLCEKKLLELFIFGTSIPLLKLFSFVNDYVKLKIFFLRGIIFLMCTYLKNAFWSRINFHKCLHILLLLHLNTITCFFYC